MEQQNRLYSLSYIQRTNLDYIESLYESFKKNKDSVSMDWRLFFEGFDFAIAQLPQSSAARSQTSAAAATAWTATTSVGSTSTSSGSGSGSGSQAALAHYINEVGIYEMIQAYRMEGHKSALLNPLQLKSKANAADEAQRFENFNLNRFHLSPSHTKYQLGLSLGLSEDKTTLENIEKTLREYYCGTLTCQMPSTDPKVRAWFFAEFEKMQRERMTSPTGGLSVEKKKMIFHKLLQAETFEKFLHTRFVGKKRFSMEGGESTLVILEELLTQVSDAGGDECVLGMAHRGRLNVLAHTMEKPISRILAEFEGVEDEFTASFDGDVKYHMGYSSDRSLNGQKSKLHLSMAYNPSHLETVDPIVMGMTRAKQHLRRDESNRSKVLPILIHGDSAFSSQGVVAETLQFSRLPGYTVGGSIHIVIDNQVGFTTDAVFTRSSNFASDLTRAIEAPVLLVNGDDPEAALWAATLAFRYRQTFQRDVVVHVVCYRRYGHNEGDEPAFTQPLMYDQIKAHPTTLEQYIKRLESEGVLKPGEAATFIRARADELQMALDQTRKTPPEMKSQSFEGAWKGLKSKVEVSRDNNKSTSGDDKLQQNKQQQLMQPQQMQPATLDELSKVLTEVPADFHPHAKIKKLLESREQMLQGDGKIDWGLGELITYGSLLADGISIRLSGQDSVRGTFTHRHSGYSDVQNGKRIIPLRDWAQKKSVVSSRNGLPAQFEVWDSSLSEYGVMGFEYGYSLSDPDTLTLWEAQFGDFVNGAQIIIDQYIASAEQKWSRSSGLVLLLPHGMEGQGPEHSSARPERFLQLCAQDNIQVAQPTTPAQLYHLLRRQMKRDFRKPLVVLTPKSLLRHPLVVSKKQEFLSGGFQEVMTETELNLEKIKRVVLCTGKLYYELLDFKQRALSMSSASPYFAQAEQTAIVRLEQLYPFPKEQLSQALNGLRTLNQVIWAQEEPQNMGYWFFVRERIQETLSVAPVYRGRSERASPATGYEKRHKVQQEELIQSCFVL